MDFFIKWKIKNSSIVRDAIHSIEVKYFGKESPGSEAKKYDAFCLIAKKVKISTPEMVKFVNEEIEKVHVQETLKKDNWYNPKTNPVNGSKVYR